MHRTRTLLLLTLAACTSQDSGLTSRAYTIDTLPGGITNTRSTAPSEPGMWALQHERDVHPAAGLPGELLDPEDVALADDGTLYVVEGDPAIINVYGPDGTFVRSIGSEGAGPGEFTAGFIALRGDTLVLQDPQQSRATVYRASTGEVLSIRPTTCCFYSPIRVDADGRTWIPMMAPPDTTGAPVRSFLTLSLAGDDADTVLVPEDPAVANTPRWNVTGNNGQMRMSATVPMQPGAHEEVDPTGGLLIGYSANYQLHRTTNGRDTVALLGRTYTPVPVTGAERQALVDDRVKQQLAFGGDNGLDEILLRKAFDPSLIPDQRPAYQRLYVDGRGRTWVMQATADTTAVHLDLFGQDGIWLDSLALPEPGWARQPYASVAFSKDRLAVVGEDADGLPVVRIYRIERSSR
ncbi:MAG TPA: hypothetical protein VFN22_07140 [Gemmatimonadales bacterium]|nr:hypothetical protein [Gemmatimonadales bacterium]